MASELRQTITYKWWSEEEIPEQCISVMEEHALERSQEMIKEGYICGELNVDIVYGGKTTTYKGWWEFDSKAS